MPRSSCRCARFTISTRVCNYYTITAEYRRLNQGAPAKSVARTKKALDAASSATRKNPLLVGALARAV